MKKFESPNYYNARVAIEYEKLTLVRSSNLDRVQTCDVKSIKSAVNGIVDLRYLFKECSSKAAFAEHGLKYFNRVIDVKPLYEYYAEIGKGDIKDKIDARFRFCIGLLEEETTVRGILEAISRCDYRAWIYCNNGRYRTGFICLLIQKLFGMSDDEIIEDFIKSSDNIDDSKSLEEERLSKEESRELVERLLTAFNSRGYIERFRYFVDEYREKQLKKSKR